MLLHPIWAFLNKQHLKRAELMSFMNCNSLFDASWHNLEIKIKNWKILQACCRYYIKFPNLQIPYMFPKTGSSYLENWAYWPLARKVCLEWVGYCSLNHLSHPLWTRESLEGHPERRPGESTWHMHWFSSFSRQSATPEALAGIWNSFFLSSRRSEIYFLLISGLPASAGLQRVGSW